MLDHNAKNRPKASFQWGGSSTARIESIRGHANTNHPYDRTEG